MAWFLRAIELDTGQWSCRRGNTEFDQHAELEHACEHLRSIARGLGSSRIFVHSLDGTVTPLDDGLSADHPQGPGWDDGAAAEPHL